MEQLDDGFGLISFAAKQPKVTGPPPLFCIHRPSVLHCILLFCVHVTDAHCPVVGVGVGAIVVVVVGAAVVVVVAVVVVAVVVDGAAVVVVVVVGAAVVVVVVGAAVVVVVAVVVEVLDVVAHGVSNDGSTRLPPSSIVTAPFSACKRAIPVAPLPNVIDASATIVPTNDEPEPRVADEPTRQKTLVARALSKRTIAEADAVVSVDPMTNTQFAFGLPPASSVSDPVIPRDVAG